jgi:aminomethyltransferase
MTVYVGQTAVGEITSGTFSPTRKIGVALALLDTAAGLSVGDSVEVDVRGRRSVMTVTKPPFVTPSVRS